jgi:hypothetical protein
MTTAFVLGNGRSRLAVDLNSLRSYGKIYGCNALYREFTPDVLVATDPGISEEIQRSGYSLNNEFHTRKPIDDLGAIKLTRHYGYSSGPNTLFLALQRGVEKIFMLGFDLDSPGDGRFNNVYAGTEFYKPSGSDQTYYGNWVQQIAEIAKGETAQIVRVNDSNVFPDSWQGIIREVKMIQFLDAINNCKLEAL